MIKIYGHPGTSAGRCYWMLEELGLEYEQVPFNMRSGDHKKPDYLKLNPNGKIPCMVDGDFVLYESVAINHYLAEKYAPEFLGATLEDRAITTQWSVWSMAEYQRPVIELFIQKVFVPEPRRDQVKMDDAIVRIKKLNEILDQSLMGRNYLVDHEFRLADLNVASVAQLNAHVGVGIDHLPNLQNWLSKINERPALAKLAEISKM